MLNIADGDSTSLNPVQLQRLQSGKPTTLLGLSWIVTNRLPVDGNGDRMCPIWTKANILANILADVWQDSLGRMWNDTSAKNTPCADVGAYVDLVRA